MKHPFDFIASAQRTLLHEGQAVSALAQQLNDSFTQACQTLADCTGKVVVTGMGKSGHIGQKIAATLSSTGSPAFYLHPGEAAHGDLGAISDGDVVIALSNSGSSDEIVLLFPSLKNRNIPLIALTSNPDSPLAKASDVCVLLHCEAEACPHNLSPTTSTTLALACGDALAIALMEYRNLTPQQYALFHPSGRLGRRLSYRASDVMLSDNLPLIERRTVLSDALLEMSRYGYGFGIVCTESGDLYGVFSDGDLRRALQHSADALQLPVGELCTTSPVTVDEDCMATQAIALMEERQIYNLVVVCEQRPKGLLTMHELIQRGVV